MIECLGDTSTFRSFQLSNRCTHAVWAHLDAQREVWGRYVFPSCLFQAPQPLYCSLSGRLLTDTFQYFVLFSADRKGILSLIFQLAEKNMIIDLFWTWGCHLFLFFMLDFDRNILLSQISLIHSGGLVLASLCFLHINLFVSGRVSQTVACEGTVYSWHTKPCFPRSSAECLTVMVIDGV